jgi:general secretion pathway protein I
MSYPRPNQLRRGFTLVEVLAATLLVGIVLPACMRAISVSTLSVLGTKHRNEAAELGHSKLDEIISTGQYLNNSSLSGDFGPDWPSYQWTAQMQDWNPNGSPPTTPTGTTIEQLDLHVTWTERGQERELVLSTLTYASPNAGNATTTQ